MVFFVLDLIRFIANQHTDLLIGYSFFYGGIWFNIKDHQTLPRGGT